MVTSIRQEFKKLQLICSKNKRKRQADEKDGEFQKNFGIYKKKQLNILELKKIDLKLKSLDGANSRLDTKEEIVNSAEKQTIKPLY